MVRYYRSLKVAWRLLRTYVVTYARNCPALIPPRVMGENRSGLRGVGPKPVVNGGELPRPKPRVSTGGAGRANTKMP